MIPIYIISFNRLSYLKQILEFVHQLPDSVPIIVDNDSSYMPLLEWYEHCDEEIISMDSNYGHLVVWEQDILSRNRDRFGYGNYVVTDPDLDFSSCPTDVLFLLDEGLKRYPWAIKAGVSLEINDIPSDFPFRNWKVDWESRFWKDSLDGQFFRAATDTTFALYRGNEPFRKGVGNWLGPAIRSNRPYTARHLPWYCSISNLTEEDVYYISHANFASATISQDFYNLLERS